MQDGDTLDIELPGGGSNPTATKLRPKSDLVLEAIDFHHIIPQYQCFALGWLLQTLGDSTSMAIINKTYSGTAGRRPEPWGRDSSDEAVRACALRFRAALIFGFYGPTNRTDNPGQNPEAVRPPTFSDFHWQIVQRVGRSMVQMCPELANAVRGQTVTLTADTRLIDGIKEDLTRLLSRAGTHQHSGYVHPFWPNDWMVDGAGNGATYLMYFRPISGRTKTAYPYVRGLAEVLANPDENEAYVNTAFAGLIAQAAGDERLAQQIVRRAENSPPLTFRVRRGGDRPNFLWNRYVVPEADGQGLSLLTPPVHPCVPFKKGDRPEFYAVT